MNVYRTERIRNVVLLGHGGAGRTTAAEALALLTGVTKRMGKVPDGNTISDYDREEVKGQSSISTTLIPLEYEGEDGLIKINLLDTSEFFDFVGEVEEAIGVADAVTIVVSCRAGIELDIERVWEMCEKYNLSRLIFATNIDNDHASYRELVVKLGTKFGRRIALFQLSIRENEKFVGFVNVVKMGGRRSTNLNDHEECEIPDYIQENLTTTRDALTETVTETSEEYMERCFLEEEFTQKEISTALRTHVIEGDITPITMDSGINCQGSKTLLQAIDKYFPSPDHFECIGVDVSIDERLTVKYNDDVPLSARVSKTIVDPFTGKHSLMKICTGTLEGDTVVYNVNKGTEEKTGKFYTLRDKDQTEMQELRTGDIGVVAKLVVTQTDDTMIVRTTPIVCHKLQTSTPYTYIAYKAANKGEDDKISTVLVKMIEEDLTLKVVDDAESRRALLCGIGGQRLDAAVSKLQSRYKVNVILGLPKLVFRETLRRKVKAQGEHKKQPGGHRQYDDVIMGFKPSDDLETLYVSEEKIFGGFVPRNYFPAVEKGLQECVLRGPLVGYSVAGLRAILLDGSYHPVDSSETASKTATVLALKQGFMEANPVLLEPIASLRVIVPDRFVGGIMGGLNRRRGCMLGMNSDRNGKQVIEADTPMLELFGCNTDLHSVTSGLDGYSYKFSRYEQAPGDVQKRGIEAGAAAKDGK